MSQYLASLRAVNRFIGKRNTLSCDGPWRAAELLMADRNNEEVYDKKPQRPLRRRQRYTQRSGKSEA